VLRPAYADVLANVVELRVQGMTHAEVCKTLNRLNGSRIRRDGFPRFIDRFKFQS
jgi:hypothetical protein